MLTFGNHYRVSVNRLFVAYAVVCVWGKCVHVVVAGRDQTLCD